MSAPTRAPTKSKPTRKPEKLKRVVWPVVEQIEKDESLKFPMVEPDLFGAIAE